MIIDDTQHPESLKRIQEIEAVRPAEPGKNNKIHYFINFTFSEPVELPPEAPSFTQQLNGQIDGLVEGHPLHLEASVIPLNDPNLRIEW